MAQLSEEELRDLVERDHAERAAEQRDDAGAQSKAALEGRLRAELQATLISARVKLAVAPGQSGLGEGLKVDLSGRAYTAPIPPMRHVLWLIDGSSPMAAWAGAHDAVAQSLATSLRALRATQRDGSDLHARLAVFNRDAMGLKDETEDVLVRDLIDAALCTGKRAPSYLIACPPPFFPDVGRTVLPCIAEHEEGRGCDLEKSGPEDHHTHQLDWLCGP